MSQSNKGKAADLLPEIEIVTMAIKNKDGPLPVVPPQEEQVSEQKGEEEAAENDESGNQEAGPSKQGDAQFEQNNEQSNISEKSSKNESGKSSNEQQFKSQMPKSRKCFNKECNEKRIFRKIRSRVQQSKYRFFCNTCYANYYNNRYCEFCEQVYQNNYEKEDDYKWIGCDKCDRWNHFECQRKYRNRSIQELNENYQCLACTLKAKSATEKGKDKDDEKVNFKIKHEISKDERIMIFNKKIQSFTKLENFLQNYSFRLWMNENMIREDLEQLRAVSCKPVDGQFKQVKNKKVKLD